MAGKKKYSRRTVALFWCFLVAVVIGVMISFEQIAMLYVFATIGLVVLLIVVGYSDLKSVGRDVSGGFTPKQDR